MLKKVVEAVNALKFLTNAFPPDDSKHKPMRDSFLAAIEHLNELRKVLEEEEHTALQKAKAPGDECPCSGCKAERFLEVLTNLDRDQLLDIIATESGIDISNSLPCDKHAEPPKNAIVFTESTVETASS